MKEQKMNIQEIPIDKIKNNPYQTRETIEKEPLKVLVKSIRERGLFSPISLLKEGNEYIVISGHRRLSAFKELRRKTIPAIVKNRKNNNNELSIDLVHENLVREDLTPIEKALSIRLLISDIKSTKNDTEKMISLIGVLKNYKRRGYVPEHRREATSDFKDEDVYELDKILKSINVSENNASTYLTLLSLPQEIKSVLCFNKKGKDFVEKITVHKAEQLARIKDEEFQKYVFRRAMTKGSTGRHVQALADMYVKKVTSGEWKGFDKPKPQNKIRDDALKLEKLTGHITDLTCKLESFKVDTLLKLDATMEKTLFVASLIDLKRGLDTLRNRVNEKLRDKGYSKVNDKIDTFEIDLQPMKDKNMLRFTFPANVRKALNLSVEDKATIEVKIIGVKIGDKNANA